MGKSSRKYHHGDLRNALVEAGIAILADAGLEALTLRAAAAKAGVSHAAPAHHFGSLQGLLTAIATDGFTRFHAAIETAMSSASAAPVERLRAAGRAYVGFAVEHPAIIQLMFSGPRLDWSQTPLCEAADRAYAQLSEIVRPAAAHLGIASEERRRELELMVLEQHPRLRDASERGCYRAWTDRGAWRPFRTCRACFSAHGRLTGSGRHDFGPAGHWSGKRGPSLPYRVERRADRGASARGNRLRADQSQTCLQ